MSGDGSGRSPDEDLAQALADVYEQLMQTAAEERAGVIRRHVDEHGVLHLPESERESVDLRRVDLSGADLGGADLRGTQLIEANLEGADLGGAWLEGVWLLGANLRRANLRSAHLRDAKLPYADLRGAQLERADLQGAGLSATDLQGATLEGANLRGADLRSADLRDAKLHYADLRGADLHNARLQGLDLTQSELGGICVADAWFERTKLWRAQLGEAIGEELQAEDRRLDASQRASLYGRAERGYLALKQNFDGLGDYAAASWAYRKERRMRKLRTLQEARVAAKAGRWRATAGYYRRYLADQCFAEWLCDYGESVGRVAGVIAVVFAAFTLLYGLTGSVVRDGAVVCQLGRAGAGCNWFDLAHFSLAATATMGVSGLEGRQPWVEVVLRLQGVLSIALFGLLGFVVGNRIRRS